MPSLKERIKLRTKKLEDGRQSCYLDYEKDGKRIREAIRLYLLPETNSKNVAANKRTLHQAEAMRREREAELTFYENSISEEAMPASGKPMLEVMHEYAETLKGHTSRNVKSDMAILWRHLSEYRSGDISLSDIDKDYCDGFIDFLLRDAKTQLGRKITMNGAEMVVYRLSAVLNYAVEKGLLEKSPMTYIKVSERIKKQFNEKVYLTKDELKRLMDTQCPVLSRPQVKQAYLLACFTGLQYGDIAGLMWKDIKPGEHGDTIPMLSRKTRAPLSDIAKRWLPDVKDKRLQVFKGLPSDVRFSQILQEWAAKAGVTKKLNFIIARNTFIYMLLTTGTTLATLAQIMNFTGVHRKYRLIEYAKMAGIQLSSREEISDYITTNYNL